MKKGFIQVGIKATRTPSGLYGKSEPIYVRSTRELEERKRVLDDVIEREVARQVMSYMDKLGKKNRKEEGTNERT